MEYLSEQALSKGLRVSVAIRSAPGVKTTVSIPAHALESYVAKCGSFKVFRKYLNRAVQEVEPRPGYSRSVLIRLYLDERIKPAEGMQ